MNVAMAQPLILNPEQDDDAGSPTGLASKLIENVGVSLEAYLGSARMTVAELVKLKESSLVTLDVPLSQAVELRLNGVAVAKGELVAVGDNFAIRLTEVAK